jgi:hypothetical protein
LLLLFGVFVFGDVKEMLRPRDFHIGMISKAKRHPLSPFVLRHAKRSTEFFRFVLFVSFRQFDPSRGAFIDRGESARMGSRVWITVTPVSSLLVLRPPEGAHCFS